MKRLDFAHNQHWEPLPIMEPNSTGDYVEYVEYEEAMEEIERLAAEIKRLKDALRRAADEPNIDRARTIADAALEGK